METKKVSAITSQTNFPSQKLIEKLGLTYQKNVSLPGEDELLKYYELENLVWRSIEYLNTKSLHNCDGLCLKIKKLVLFIINYRADKSFGIFQWNIWQNAVTKIYDISVRAKTVDHFSNHFLDYFR